MILYFSSMYCILVKKHLMCPPFLLPRAKLKCFFELLTNNMQISFLYGIRLLARTALWEKDLFCLQKWQENMLFLRIDFSARDSDTII